MPQGTQDTSNANPVPVSNALGLANGMNPLVIPLNVDLSVNTSVLVDMTQQQQRGQIGPIQTIYINNSDNAQDVTIVTQILNQEIVIPGGDSAILPIFLATTAPKFTVNTTGGVVVPIMLMNFPLPAEVWGASFGGSTFQTVNGLVSMNVVDTALQALISNIGGAGPALDVNVLSGGSGGGGGGPSGNPPATMWSETFSPLATGIIAINTTTISAAGKFSHAVGLTISVSPDIHDGVGTDAELAVAFGGSSGYIWRGGLFVPSAAIATPNAGYTQIVAISGFDIKGNQNDTPDLLWSGPTVTAGKLAVTVFGYLSNT